MEKIRKIPIRDLIEILSEIYDCGVDFVDILGETTNKEDSITISFIEEYVNPEHLSTFEEDINALDNAKSNINLRKLTDDELNDLI